MHDLGTKNRLHKLIRMWILLIVKSQFKKLINIDSFNHSKAWKQPAASVVFTLKYVVCQLIHAVS